MDNEQTGRLIRLVRVERGLTQRELAELVGVSDKAVSKWERGLGAPDIALLSVLSRQLGVEVASLLEGESQNRASAGSLKQLRVFRCPRCGETALSFGNARITCCSRQLAPLQARPAEGEHLADASDSDGERYLTLSHPMGKDHHLCLALFVQWDRFTAVRLYPEQEAALRLPSGPATLYTLCTKHGLFAQDL